jgi:hypothetical protein
MDEDRGSHPKYYFLSKHVFICSADDFVFILDLRQDKYFALDAVKSRSLSAWVAGWPICGGEGATLRTQGAALARRLLDKGILSMEAASGKSATPVSLATAVTQLPDQESSRIHIVRQVLPACVFVMTWLVACVQFRCYRLERLIETITAKRCALRDEARLFDYSRAQRLLRVARRLRPFLLTSRDGCLFESFVLVKFLAVYGLYPCWVFGIRASPFGAHCWIQHDGTVLNDTVEHIKRLTPILLV